MTFRVGQKIICVDASAWHGWNTIKQDAIYTIAGIECHSDGTPALHLVEVASIWGVPYYAYRFRPVVERKTDISIFKRMLNPQHIHKADPPLVG